MNSCRVLYYLFTNSTQTQTSLPFGLLTLGVVLNVSSLVGLALGNFLSVYVDQSKFMLIILSILFAGSVLLATVACDKQLTTIVSMLALVVFVCIMIARNLAGSGNVNKESAEVDGVTYNALSHIDKEGDTIDCNGTIGAPSCIGDIELLHFDRGRDC